MKRIKTIVITVLIFLNIFVYAAADDINEGGPSIPAFPSAGSSVVSTKPPVIEAGAAVVMDTESGRVLFEKNAYSRRAMASTTKIMTAILALENGNPDDIVTISKRADSIGGSTVGLRTGQKYTLHELMYGLMLNSGNDAAIAIAEHISGSVEGFVEAMNRKALELGAKDTSFHSPHGLDAPDHYSTAYDLALITRYALKNPEFSKIVGTKSTRVGGMGLYNTNEMLDLYPGADGVKTGYTSQAGRCLVTSATRDNWRIISVVLNCGTRTQRARSSKSILDYAFDNYEQYTLLEQEQVMKRLPVYRGIYKDVAVIAEKEIRLPLRQDEADAMQTEVELPERLEAPVEAGVNVGKIQFVLEGKVLAESELKTDNSVRRKNFMDYFKQIIETWEELMRVA